MTTHAHVVIVGGGILGCSLAYHLTCEGWSDCVLVEKGELTSGSTWHAAGQVTHSTSSYGLGRMAGYAIELYERIEAETTVVRVEDERFYCVLAAFFEMRLLDWLSRHRRPDEDIRIENVSSASGAVALQGPRSREVLAQVTQTPLDNTSFPWLTARTVSIAGANVRALRLSYAGELGWELHVPAADLPAVFDALWSAGDEFGIAHYGSFAMNAMRMEKMFKGASELTNEVTLPEADAMRFARLDKPGGFIGREATQASAARRERPWQCVYLEVDAGDADCLGGEAILAGGERTGTVSSGAWGPTVSASLAFGYVRPEHATPGTNLVVLVLGEPRPARVLAEARYDPGNLRPRS